MWLQKINRLFLRNNRLFLLNNRLFFAKQSVVYINSVKNKAKTILKIVRIERLKQIVYTASLFTKSYIQSLATIENSLSNKKPWLHTTHQSGDLESFKNTHHLWKNTPQFLEQPLKLHNNNSQRITIVNKEWMEYTWV